MSTFDDRAPRDQHDKRSMEPLVLGDLLLMVPRYATHFLHIAVTLVFSFALCWLGQG